MKILKNLFKKSYSIIKTKENRIQFHGEQSGTVENKIKKVWSLSLIEFSEVEEAYLTLAQFDSKVSPHPILCVYPKCSNPKRIVEKLSYDFKQLFSSEEYVDILFLSKKMRNDCQSKCKPFYKRIKNNST